MMIRTASVLILALAPAAFAQTATGATLDGFIFDSIRGLPLSGASIRIAKTTITSDSTGRFTASNLPAGTHQVTFRHPILDSLGVLSASKPVTLKPNESTYLDLGIPSARTLLTALCQRAESGVLGVVRDAETDAPIPRASVRLSWSVIDVDRKVGIRRQLEFRAAQTDANGLFAICDAPADLDQGTLVAFAKDFELAQTETYITGGAAVQHMYLGRTGSDSTTLVGTVLNADAAPVEAAEVFSRDTTGVSARTNAHGMFVLAGLRPGTQMIEIRKLGHQRIRRSIALPAGRAITLDPITLPAMIARLPEVTVREKSTAEQFGFHDRMKVGRGRFLTREQIQAQKQILRSSDLIRELIPSMRLEMKSGQMIITNESLRQNIKGKTCAMPVYIDGVPAPTDLALDITPQDIDGVEVYNAPEMVPAEYAMRSADGNAPCGAILIWTTWRNRKTQTKP
jgi:hypothetical protein